MLIFAPNWRFSLRSAVGLFMGPVGRQPFWAMNMMEDAAYHLVSKKLRGRTRGLTIAFRAPLGVSTTSQ